MGMFDWIDYECVCPICRSKVDGFQSKDGGCEYGMNEIDASEYSFN